MPHSVARSWWVVFIIGTFSFMNGQTTIAQEAKGRGASAKTDKAKIVFIGDTDRRGNAHAWIHTSRMIAKAVELTPRIETVVSQGWPKDPETLKGARAIVAYMPPAGDHFLAGAGRNQFHDMMKDGVGLVLLHYAASISKGGFERNGPTWLSYTGGTWVVQPVTGLSSGKSLLKQLLPEHPISRGWKEFEVDDEYYLDPVIEKAKPLLQVTERKGKDVIVGWVYERPNGGRSFSTTLGHFHRSFQNDHFRRLVVNGILWSARLDVPRDGVPVALSAADLAEPPVQPKMK